MRHRELIMKVHELIMKVWELIMNTNPKNEGAIADNEHMKARIPELIYNWLLIRCLSLWSFYWYIIQSYHDPAWRRKVNFQCERRHVAECLMFDAFVCIFLRVQWESVEFLNAIVGLKKGINYICFQSRPIKPVLRSRKLSWRDDSSGSFVSIDKILTVMLDTPSF